MFEIFVNYFIYIIVKRVNVFPLGPNDRVFINGEGGVFNPSLTIGTSSGASHVYDVYTVDFNIYRQVFGK